MNTGRWEIISLEGSLGPHTPAWDALNQRFFRGNPMLHSRFVDPLLKYFGDGTEKLCIHTIVLHMDIRK